MPLRKSILLAVAIFVVAAAVLAVALNAGAETGRTVTVTHGKMTTTLIDNGEPGPSQGDVRIFDVRTSVAGSTAHGRMEAVMTTTAVGVPTADWEQRVAELVFTFRGGRDQIVVDGAAKYPVAGSTLVANAVTIRPITGGCGAYAGARGYCESILKDNGAWRHVFHLK